MGSNSKCRNGMAIGTILSYEVMITIDPSGGSLRTKNPAGGFDRCGTMGHDA